VVQQCGAIKSFALFDNGVRGNTVQMLAKLNHDEACRLGKRRAVSECGQKEEYTLFWKRDDLRNGTE
jgi:hypothetical protein